MFVDNLVWEDIDNYLVISDIPYYYFGPCGFKEVVENIFQTFTELIILTSVMPLEYFRWVTEQSKKLSVASSWRQVQRSQVG